ncbi:MAG: hypothetical protein R2706_20170 [Acidimicrobiales bacterium]
MKVGLLQIDSLDEPHRSLGGDYDHRYGELFRAAGADFVVFDGRANPLPDPAECDAWLVPGSRASVYDDVDWITRLLAWTRAAYEAGHILFGICFGHQLIAAALGARSSPRSAAGASAPATMTSRLPGLACLATAPVYAHREPSGPGHQPPSPGPVARKRTGVCDRRLFDRRPGLLCAGSPRVRC